MSLPVSQTDKPIWGYRGWRVNGGRTLISQVEPFRYPVIGDGHFKARCYPLQGVGCLSIPHEAPAPEGHCGFYLYKRTHVAECLERISNHKRGLHVLGAAIVWGTVVEHDELYRAEYIRTVGVIIPPPQSLAQARAVLNLSPLIPKFTDITALRKYCEEVYG